MHRFWLILISLMLILAVVPLTACDDSNSNEENKLPERIISLSPGNTEILFALGLADRIIGVTKYCDYPPEAKEKDQIGGFKDVDMELVIEADPDLILAANIHKTEVVPELERRGFNVITIAPGTVDEVLESILEIGEITGTSERANEIVADMRSRIDAVTQKVADISETEKPGVLYLTSHDPIWSLGKGTITHELIELAGGINIFADIDGHGQTELETIIWRNPQVILVSSGHGSLENSPVTWAQTEDRLSDIDARIDNRIYPVDADIVTRPCPRIVDGLELVAKCIHPDLFSE